MRKIKKILVAILSLVLTLSSLSGCSTPNKKDDNNTLTMIYARSVPMAFIDGLMKKFPDINFELEFYQGASFTEYAYQALSHGEAGDIFVYSLALSEEDAEKYLVDLSGYTFMGSFDTAILDSIARDGHVYHVPGPVSSRCILYNKTLFDMYGWEAPTTFNELLALVKQIRTDAPDITPLAMPMPAAGYPFTMITSPAQCGFLATPEGAEWEERYFRGEASVAEGFDEGFTIMEKLIDANAFDGEKYVGLWHVISGDPCERKAAMSISLGGTQPVLPLLEKTATQDVYGTYCTDEFGLLPFFGLEDGQEGLSVTLSTTWALNKSLEEKGNEKKLENALRVMEYLSTAEAQLLLQTDNGQIPTIKNLENTKVHPEVQKLWNLNENGKKSVFLYSGYEDIMIDTGNVVMEAILADSSEGMREKFIAVSDEIRKETLAGKAGVKVYGQVAENLSHEETARLSMEAVMEKNPADFILATNRGISDGVINSKGVGGRLFIGDVTENILSTIIQTYNNTIVTVELTGAEVIDLLQNGKILKEGDKEACFKYIAYGLDVQEKDGVITSVKHKGEALDENKVYTVNFHQDDYTGEFAQLHTIVDTEMMIQEAIGEYLQKYSPISSDTIK